MSNNRQLVNINSCNACNSWSSGNDVVGWVACNDNKNDLVPMPQYSNENGFYDIKTQLALQYERNYSIPNIEVVGANLHEDRKLILKYNTYRERTLNDSSKEKMLKHLKNLWGYEVVIE